MAEIEEKPRQETVKYTNDFTDENQAGALERAGLESMSRQSLRKSFFQRNKKRIIAISVVVLLAIGAGVWQAWQKNRSAREAQGTNPVTVQIPQGSDHVFINDVSGVSTLPAGSEQGAANMASENFKMKEITFGTGSVALYSGESENQPLVLSDVHSEVLTGNNDSDVKLLVTWKTNKLSRASVRYDKGGAELVLVEGGYGFSHALVLADLERSTRYTFMITGIDRWGNSANSDTFNAFIGPRNASVFDLISQQFSQMFGWAVKK